MNLLFKRPDGTFVAEVNGMPYHVTDDDPIFAEAHDQAIALGDGLPFEPAPEAPEPVQLTRLHKAELWRRLTEAEADALDAALAAAPTRLRRIFEVAQYLDAGDPDYPSLRDGIVAALGEARADEVLAPTH